MKLNDSEELCEAIDGGTEIEQDTWRWGSVHTVVFQKDGSCWEAVYYTQPEMGLDDVNTFPMECVEVEPYEKTITCYRKKS